ncbi:aftiphilin isoform X2 [Bombina bombina]|uniref:aftiphilin isoform X2 n=1 Tax=Bombina bombina TaxID=8345 RepID=UPI00235A8674|nr:aftiphilin isoform X2 [Bombina bombina]
MEPEIIRMYSSSPPPLDNVADDDDEDEFGEFGGFSTVNNSGFADFSPGNYPQEDFLHSKHFMPIHDYADNVNNFSSLNSINEKENFSDHTGSKKGSSNVCETNISNDAIQFNAAAVEIKGSTGEKVKTVDIHINSESNGTEVNSRCQEQPVNTCNGEKLHCLENLTNGFAVEDSVNPQGIDDLDSVSNSKGFNTNRVHSPGLTLDFTPSPSEDFADFSSFSVPIEDGELNIQTEFSDGSTSIKTNCTVSRVDDYCHFETHVPSEIGDEPIDQVLSNCTSKTHTVIENNEPPKNVSLTPDINTSVSVTFPPGDVVTGDFVGIAQFSENDEEEMLQSADGISLCVPDNLEGIKNIEHCLRMENNNFKNELSNISDSQRLSKSVPSVHPDDVSFGNFDGNIEDLPSFTDQSKSDDLFKDNVSPDMIVNELNDDFCEFEDTNVTFQEDLHHISNERLVFHSSGDKYLDTEHNEGSVSLVNNDGSSTFQDTDDFADFSSANNTNPVSEWKAFDNDQSETTWTAFDEKKVDHLPTEADSWTTGDNHDQVLSVENVTLENVPLSTIQEAGSHLVSEGLSSTSQQSLLSRLERIVSVCFPLSPVVEVEHDILSLEHLLNRDKCKETSESLSREVPNIWTDIQDIHEAFGLKYQWGGSHSNKKLLCSLGIDTRNILFTGNKKQPVIVPMYAAGLGMLEPTKEPLKPLSAAEKIASIGQSSPVPSEESIITSDPLQESLPPIQFDWSSSGLTNPLDGVDPELYELTTSKLDYSNASNKVTDAFARLMSTAETTSTSARKPRRDENLSDEAAKVIASLPDLSFMHAKVLMFPATLTPSTSSQEKAG